MSHRRSEQLSCIHAGQTWEAVENNYRERVDGGSCADYYSEDGERLLVCRWEIAVHNVNYIAEPYIIRCDKKFGKSLLVSIISHIMSVLHVAGRRWLGSFASSITPVVCSQNKSVSQTDAVLSEMGFVSWTFKPLEWFHCSCGTCTALLGFYHL